MFTSLLKRLLYVIALLFIVSVIAFWLSKQVPGDEVSDYISIDDRGAIASYNPAQYRDVYKRVAEQRGFDLPEFYFSLMPSSVAIYHTGTLPEEDRATIKQWIRSGLKAETSLELYQKLRDGLSKYCSTNNQYCRFYERLLTTTDPDSLAIAATKFRDESEDTALMREVDPELETISLLALKSQNNTADFSLKNFTPVFRWHGSANQYHRWITGLVYQRPLTSIVDGRNAWSKILDALKWTVLLNGFALFISIVAGTLLGIWSGRTEGLTSEKIVNWILFGLFALPSFWLGTLFIYAFASGEWLSLFPAGGLGSHRYAGNILERGSIVAYHLFLPVMCLALGALAYISRQVKQSVLYEYRQPYVAMLKAQGISSKTILRKHIVRNSLFPLITIMGGAFPALLSGSLIIEVIFNIPGMGRLMYSSLLARDWPVAFPILMFSAVITIASYIATDIVYKWADPRVKVLTSS